jgi:hypothetical protein
MASPTGLEPDIPIFDYAELNEFKWLEVSRRAALRLVAPQMPTKLPTHRIVASRPGRNGLTPLFGEAHTESRGAC